ncbi:MAG: helix-turn-helix domain-containing protein [Chloroflexaceae bacterium]
MPFNGTIPENAPLSVLLFYAAMENGQSLSNYAQSINVGAISLRQFISGTSQRPRQRTLELIGEALDMPVEEVRRRMQFAPATAPNFGEWLQAKMEGRFSRAKLTRATRISDGALRNYLHNQTLPDADQARRLAEVLGVPAYEMASVIIANTVQQHGGALAPASRSAAEERPPAVAAPATAKFAAPLPTPNHAPVPGAPALASLTPSAVSPSDELRLLDLWRQLHPQARRATLNYIAMLLAER